MKETEMITLHAFGRVHPLVHGLTRDLRVQWALEELGLPYEVRGVDHTGGETGRDEFLRISPFKQLPVIDDDGFVLAESGAILLYLAEKAGRLADPRTRATVTRWCFAALTTIEPVVATIVLTDFDKKTDDGARERRARLVKLTERGLGGLEAWLGEHTFVTGAELTVADILMTTVLRQARRAGLLAKYPRCEAYRRRCEARPAWARTVAAYEARLGAEPGAVDRAAEPT
jgi:glutathione S-transferase